MAQALPHSSHDTPESVAQQLRNLRMRLVLWLIVDGLSYLLPLVLLLAACDFLIDYGLHLTTGYQLDLYQRGILLVLAGAAIVGVFIWRLVLPFLRRPEDDALLLQVERTHRNLGESLISAVQFARMGGALGPGVSRSMVAATIELGVRNAGKVRFAEVLDSSRFVLNFAVALSAAVLLGVTAVGIANHATLGTWFHRNVLLADEAWPQNIDFFIEGDEDGDGEITIVRGDDHQQRVRLVLKSGLALPDAVFMEFRPWGLRPAQQMSRDQKEQDQDNVYQLEFRNVLEEFDFRVYAGTAVSRWTHVKLLPPPQIDKLTLEVTPPAYTGEKIEQLPVGKGPYSVLKGSSLRIAGVATKDLESAELITEGGTHAMRVSALRRFSIELSPDQLSAGKHVLDLVDTEGLSNRRPPSFGLRIRADKPPRVRAKLIGISGMVVPQALIPIDFRITDDYVVTDVRVEYAWQGDSAAQAGKTPFPELADLLATKPRGLDDIVGFDLEPLEIPIGATMTFTLAAEDNDNVSGPNIGQSTEFLVRVVSEEQLRTDLLRREKEQRQEFEQLLKSQEDLITDTRALESSLAASETIGPDQKQTLMQIQRRQKVIATNTKTISDKLAEVITEIRNNRLEEEDGPLQQRLIEQIIVPMNRISEQLVPEAVRRLDASRRLADEGQQRDVELANAVRQQEAVAAAMREILLHMVKTEGYQEAVNLLYEIEKQQQGVLNLTTKEMQERIERILREGGNATPPPEKKE